MRQEIEEMKKQESLLQAAIKEKHAKEAKMYDEFVPSSQEEVKSKKYKSETKTQAKSPSIFERRAKDK